MGRQKFTPRVNNQSKISCTYLAITTVQHSLFLIVQEVPKPLYRHMESRTHYIIVQSLKLCFHPNANLFK